MKALQYSSTNSHLSIEEVEPPQPEKDAAVVRLLAAHVPSFSNNVFNGSLGYVFPKTEKFIPGTSAVGLVEHCDSSNGVVKKGDLVFFDNYVYAHNSPGKSEAILMGWTGLGESSALTQQRWPDGSWSEQFFCPVQNLHVIPSGSRYAPEKWASLNYLNISYGALLKGNFKSGMKVIVNGATGGLGSGAVLIALALGASKIIVVGRDAVGLAGLKSLSEDRIAIVNSAKGEGELLADLKNSAFDADILIDALGGAKTFEPTLACLRMLKKGGIAVLTGSVLVDIPLNYMEVMLRELEVCGNFMYPPHAPAELIRLVDAGLIDLDLIHTVCFSLEAFQDAFNLAERSTPLSFIMLTS